MPSEVDNDTMNGNSIDNLTSLRISSLDDEDEEEIAEEHFDDLDVSSSDDEYDQAPVSLGFVEKPKNRWSLLRQLFPSKAGGSPAWLDPINLPSGKSCVCDICGEPLKFLLQIYAPISEKESTFHRTLFVFMCPSMACLLQDQHEQWKRQPEKASRSVKVFRGQLPRHNPFYSSEPPIYNGSDKPSGGGAELCTWCGTWKGNKMCSSCKRSRYCSEKHQILHWRSGHKLDCQRIIMNSQMPDSNPNRSRSLSAEVQKVASNSLWPEYEIINEDECEYSTEISLDGALSNLLAPGDQMDETSNSLLVNFEGDGDRKSWASFQERIARAPEQVLRYCRNERAKPLWPMSSGQPCKDDVPKCSYCAGPQSFEFQILPQLLYYFGVKNDVDSLDWANIVVYTCEASCEAGLGYKEEFTWVQLSSTSAVVP